MSLLVAEEQGTSARSFHLQTHLQPNTTAATPAREHKPQRQNVSYFLQPTGSAYVYMLLWLSGLNTQVIVVQPFASHKLTFVI